MCVCARWWVCAQLSCPSSLLCYFMRRGRYAWLHSQTQGGFPPRPLCTRAVSHLGLAVGEVEEGRKEHDAAVTHVQCQSALSCSRAARATQVHLRHWVCVCARWSVCAQLSCPSSHCQTRGGFPPGPLSSLRKSNHARPPQFAVQPRVSRKVGPELALLPLAGRTHRLRDSLLWSLWSPTQQSYTGTRCHLCRGAPDCSASPLTLAK